MDDLIYNFLLQAGYPRASIILNIDVVDASTSGGFDENAPAFVIVEPETADVLAVIDVARDVDEEKLELKSLDVSHYSRMFSEDHALGFLFCVDPDGGSEQDKVKVYRVLRNARVQLLSMQNFPNYAALRVSRKLAVKTSGKANPTSPVAENGTASKTTRDNDTLESACLGRLAVYFYLPALMLLMAVIADKLYIKYIGEPLLTTAQSVLTIGAALLFSLPAAICCIEQALVKISDNKQI